jgi:hypothetical protein
MTFRDLDDDALGARVWRLHKLLSVAQHDRTDVERAWRRQVTEQLEAARAEQQRRSMFPKVPRAKRPAAPVVPEPAPPRRRTARGLRLSRRHQIAEQVRESRERSQRRSK